MAFTVNDFPNLVFENVAQYHQYLKTRKTIRARLLATTPSKTRVVKIAAAVKNSDPLFEYVQKCVSSYLTTLSSRAHRQTKNG